MRVTDTHCHVDLYPDVPRTVDDIERSGIETIAVTNAPSVFRHCAALARRSRLIRPALGLHPELARERRHELGLMEDLMSETGFIGEVGLDFVTRDPEERDIQRRVFGRILELCALHGNKVLTVHSRRAAPEVVDMIGPDFPGSIVLHWYSGPESALRRAVAYGCYFSVNPAMLASASAQRIIAALPRERVLAETDGPFVRVAGNPATPRDVARVVAGLAALWDVEPAIASASLETTYRTMVDRVGQ